MMKKIHMEKVVHDFGDLSPLASSCLIGPLVSTEGGNAFNVLLEQLLMAQTMKVANHLVPLLSALMSSSGHGHWFTLLCPYRPLHRIAISDLFRAVLSPKKHPLSLNINPASSFRSW